MDPILTEAAVRGLIRRVRLTQAGLFWTVTGFKVELPTALAVASLVAMLR